MTCPSRGSRSIARTAISIRRFPTRQRAESWARSNSPAPGPGRSGRDILQYVRKNGFGPRLGFAYQITPKTVVSAGGSVTYDSNREDGNADSNIQGFGGSFSAVGSYLSSGIAFQFKDGFNVTPDLVNAARPVHIDPDHRNQRKPVLQERRVRQARLFLRLQLHLGTELRPEHAAARQLPRQLRNQAAAEPEPQPARSEVSGPIYGTS